MKINLFNIVYKCLLDDTDFVASLLAATQTNADADNHLISFQLKKHPSADSYISNKESAIKEIERLRKLAITDNDLFIREASDKLKFKGLLEITRRYTPDKYDSVERCIAEGADWCYFFRNCIPFKIIIEEIKLTSGRVGKPKINKYAASIIYNNVAVNLNFTPIELALYLYFYHSDAFKLNDKTISQLNSGLDIILKRLSDKTHQSNITSKNIVKRIADVNSKIIDAIAKHGFNTDDIDIIQWYTINSSKDDCTYKLSLPKECLTLPPELKKDSH